MDYFETYGLTVYLECPSPDVVHDEIIRQCVNCGLLIVDHHYGTAKIAFNFKPEITRPEIRFFNSDIV